MLGFYTPILLLQAICVYLAYRNNAENRWYWFIMLFPGIGCGFYLFHHYYNRQNIGKISEGVKSVINSNYKIDQLEKAHAFSDSYTTRINLADAYVEFGRYDEAIKLIQDSLMGFMADDPFLFMKLLHANYLNSNFSEVISLGERLESNKDFKNSETRLEYAWALHYSGKTERAEQLFQSMDKTFTNYSHRKEYCKFLLETGRTEDLKSKVAEIVDEFDHMRGPERKIYRDVIREIQSLQNIQVT
jgi:hypothetical protein